MEQPNKINFSVDAGIINRLGQELVGRAETAVSELIKNAYDADAKNVKVIFQNTEEIGGTLIIQDDGHGMTMEQLINGFMRISSSDKVHNPTSPKFKRTRAGRKGIGRFATQRLGENLEIHTQTENLEDKIVLEINWNDYVIDKELSEISNSVEFSERDNYLSGTRLVIKNLRDIWTKSQIIRVFRYVSELLQPDYLSDRSEKVGSATQKDNSFNVKFIIQGQNGEEDVETPDSMFFDNAVAVIEGYVDEQNDGFCAVNSERFGIKDKIYPISSKKNEVASFETLKNIHFKAYYFIYNRPKYYSVPKMQLGRIQELSKTAAGIKVYRNGFRVLPYGKSSDDWLNLDTSSISRSGTQVPHGSKNFFGFVEILDTKGEYFEETASREGLIDNDAFKELSEFVRSALIKGIDTVGLAIQKEKKNDKNKGKKNEEINNEKFEESFEDFEKDIKQLLKKNDDTVDSSSNMINDNQITEIVNKTKERLEHNFKEAYEEKLKETLEELGMMRILAGLGLTIGEFIHEVAQFSPSFHGNINFLTAQELNDKSLDAVKSLRKSFLQFTTYTSYFNSAISQNVRRDLQPLRMRDNINEFLNVIEPDLKRAGIEIEKEFFGFDLFTCPMHPSEWKSILFNLYTNAKKAINRAKPQHGLINISVGKEKDNVYLEFSDNGDGIADEYKNDIFDAFFTTSTPVGFDATEDEELTGTGLGLKIVKDIIEGYGGEIYLIEPYNSKFITCFRIDLPTATEEQLESHGY
jgi:anti-sigma regulatory factor (Ser/Thr protein kinase)